MSNYSMTATALEKTDDGVSLSLERTVSTEDDMGLVGVRVIQRLDFESGGYRVGTKLVNTSDEDAYDLTFRFHNMPLIKKAEFADGATFTRNYIIELFRCGEDSAMPDLENQRGGLRITETDSARMALTVPGVAGKVNISFPESLRYVMFWDSATQPASTLEPIFDTIQLAPNGSIEYCMKVDCE